MMSKTILATGAAAVASAAIGSVGTTPDSLWYRSLRKPTWEPPPLAFPLVWTPLYVDIAVTSALALDELDNQGRVEERQALIKALVVNLVLNTGWSWLFFTAKKPWPATVECAVLAVSSADLVRRVGKAKKAAGWALAPYAIWCGFATFLSGTISRLNPGR